MVDELFLTRITYVKQGLLLLLILLLVLVSVDFALELAMTI